MQLILELESRLRVLDVAGKGRHTAMADILHLHGRTQVSGCACSRLVACSLHL